MGSVYKRTRVVKGKPVKSEKYTIKYQLADETWRQETAYRDKDASRALLVERERAVARGELGLTDPYAAFRKMPLTDHLDAFRKSILAGGATEKYATKVHNRLKRVFEATGARLAKDLTAHNVERFVLHLRDKNTAPATINHHIDAVREFAKWGVKRDRWARDPLVSVRKIRGDHDIRRKRRALSVEELERLVAAARTRALENYVRTHPKAGAAKRRTLQRQGESRAVAYQLAALAGLRFNEIKTLTWADVNFDRAPAQITIRAEHAKSKREDTIPITDSLAQELLDWRDTVAQDIGRKPNASECIVHVGARFRDSFRKDLKAAKIAEKDAMDRYADMHGLRHTCGTLLAKAKVHPKVAQQLMRHTDIRLTMEIYTHVGAEDQAQALKVLPNISGKPERFGGEDVTKYVTTKTAETDIRRQEAS